MLGTFTLCGTGPKEVSRTARMLGERENLLPKAVLVRCCILHSSFRKLPTSRRLLRDISLLGQLQLRCDDMGALDAVKCARERVYFSA